MRNPPASASTAKRDESRKRIVRVSGVTGTFFCAAGASTTGERPRYRTDVRRIKAAANPTERRNEVISPTGKTARKRYGEPARRLPMAWPASWRTLYQAKAFVLLSSVVVAGRIACSRTSAAPRSRPIPLSIPRNAAARIVEKVDATADNGRKQDKGF